MSEGRARLIRSDPARFESIRSDSIGFVRREDPLCSAVPPCGLSCGGLVGSCFAYVRADHGSCGHVVIGRRGGVGDLFV